MACHAPGHDTGNVVGGVDNGGTGGAVIGAIVDAVVVGAVVVGVVVVVAVAVVVVVGADVVMVRADVVVVVVIDGRVVVLGRVEVVTAGDDGGGATDLVVGGAVAIGIVSLINPPNSVVDVVGIGGRVVATGRVANRSVASVAGVSTALGNDAESVVGERSVGSRTRSRSGRVSARIGRNARLSGAADGTSVVVTAMARVVTVALAVVATAARGVESTVLAPPLKMISPLSGADCAAICIPRTNGAATETPADALTPPETVCTMLATGPLPDAT